MISITQAVHRVEAIQQTAKMLLVELNHRALIKEARVAFDWARESSPNNILSCSAVIVPVIAEGQDELNATSRRSSENQIQTAQRRLIVLQRPDLDRRIPGLFGCIIETPGADHRDAQGQCLGEDLLDDRAGQVPSANCSGGFFLQVKRVQCDEVGL